MTRSGGMSKYSGSWPLADSTRGRMSNLVRFPFHPSRMHTCNNSPVVVALVPKSGPRRVKFHCLTYLCELDVERVAGDGGVDLLVAGVADQLRVPHAVVMLAVGPLRENGDRRPGKLPPTTTHLIVCFSAL